MKSAFALAFLAILSVSSPNRAQSVSIDGPKIHSPAPEVILKYRYLYEDEAPLVVGRVETAAGFLTLYRIGRSGSTTAEHTLLFEPSSEEFHAPEHLTAVFPDGSLVVAVIEVDGRIRDAAVWDGRAWRDVERLLLPSSSSAPLALKGSPSNDCMPDFDVVKPCKPVPDEENKCTYLGSGWICPGTAPCVLVDYWECPSNPGEALPCVACKENETCEGYAPCDKQVSDQD